MDIEQLNKQIHHLTSVIVEQQHKLKELSQELAALNVSLTSELNNLSTMVFELKQKAKGNEPNVSLHAFRAVSYTHLTLPTILLV